MPHIFGWPRDGGGCGHYRVIYPLAALEQHDWTTSWADRLSVGLLESADIISTQRLCEPTSVKVWSMLTDKISRVLDLDDDLWEIPLANPARQQYTKDRLHNMERALEVADLITTSTEFLRDEIKRRIPGSDPIVLPNAIPDHMFSTGTPSPSSDGVVRVAWGGTPTHREDLLSVLPVLRWLVRTYPQVRLVMMGVNYLKGLVPDKAVETRPWRPLEEYVRGWDDVDIGIAPLVPCLFNYSKSGLKALEMGARAIPCVASSAPSYREVLKSGTTGFVAESPHKWKKALSTLVEDESARLEMGLAARRDFEQRYSSSVVSPLYDSAYRSLI